MWIRTISWTSKHSFAEVMRHYKKHTVPAFEESPVKSVKVIQTGPNSALHVLEFDDKRALNRHEKLLARFRARAGDDMELSMTVVDGPVRYVY